MARPTFQVRSLTIAEILDEGFRLFRHGFVRLLVFQLIVYVPTTALLTYGIVSAGDLLLAMAETSSVPEVKPLLLRFVAFVLALVSLQVVAGALVMVATSRAVADTYLGRSWTTGTILRTAFARSPAAIAVGAFLTLILGLSIGVPVGVGGVIAFSVGFVSRDAVLIILAILFGLALAVVALCGVLFLVLRYGLALVAVAVEDTSFTAALGRSVDLMRGRYARGLALFGILVAVNLLVTSVLTAFLPLPSFEGVDPDELYRMLPQLIRGQVLSTLLSQVAGVFVQIYTSICWTLFYFTARCEAEAFDLSHLAGRTRVE